MATLTFSSSTDTKATVYICIGLFVLKPGILLGFYMSSCKVSSINGILQWNRKWL